MMTLFKKAISDNHILDFAYGKNEYFVVDRDYGEHSVYQSWISEILPLFNSGEIEFVSKGIIEMFRQILADNEIEFNSKCEFILYHLHVLYYLFDENKTPKIDLSRINNKLNDCFSKYLELQTNENKINAFKNAISLIKKRGGLGR